MQARYQLQATPVRALVAMLIALAALLAAGASGYGIGRANSASHAVASTGKPGSAAVGQAQGLSTFPYGPGDRAGLLTVAPAGGQASGESAFPSGPADRAGG